MTARSFSKEIRQHNIAHAIKCYAGSGGKRAMIKEIKSFMKDNYGSSYHAIAQMVKYGCFLIHYDEQREYIRRLLKETREEANKYSDQEVFNLYAHMLARDVSTMPELRND